MMDRHKTWVETMQRETCAVALYDGESVVCCVGSLVVVVLFGDELRNIEVNNRSSLWACVGPDKKRSGAYLKRCAFDRQPSSAYW
jgi:hypothetical protein